MLIGSQLRHGNIALSAATVSLDHYSDDNQQEGQGASNGKTNQNDETKRKVVGYTLSARVILKTFWRLLTFGAQEVAGVLNKHPTQGTLSTVGGSRKDERLEIGSVIQHSAGIAVVRKLD